MHYLKNLHELLFTATFKVVMLRIASHVSINSKDC